MKFFKHFTDAHRGQSLKQLKRRHGFAAIGRYWTLVEMCAEKLDKEKEELFTEQHCVFEFEATHLMQSLGFANRKQASSYLQALAELGLCSPQATGELISCSMPKLLECLDRDAKRARTERAVAAPKNKKKIKEEDKEYSDGEKAPSNSVVTFENRFKFDLNAIFDLYPKNEKRSVAIDILANQIKTQSDYDDWKRAVTNYARRCELENTEYRYRLGFKNFASEWTDWRDWKEPDGLDEYAELRKKYAYQQGGSS